MEGEDVVLDTENPPVSRYPLSCLLLVCLALPTGGSSSPHTVSRQLTVDLGQRVVLPCGQNKSSHISWQFKGDEHLRLNTSGSLIIADTGDLLLPQARLSDAGLYTCKAAEQVVVQLDLTVRDVPSRVINMSVHTNSVFAVVSWAHSPDPAQPRVQGFHCQHRRDISHLARATTADLQYTMQELPATAGQCAVYHLLPNTTYFFRVAAYNRLGSGEFVAQAGTTRPLVRSLGVHGAALETDQGYGRVLAICLAVSLVGLATLGSGIALLLVRRGAQVPARPLQESPGEDEGLELVPHITLNPSFNIDMLEHLGEEESSEHAFLVEHGGEGG